jgi:hypothetical protein
VIGGSLQGSALYIYSFSEVLVCDYSPPVPRWVRPILVHKSAPAFPAGSLKKEHIQLSAWLCSLSGHGEEDTGWSVDEWDCDVLTDGDGEHVRVTFHVAVGGKGARLNRIGYTWTAYVSGQGAGSVSQP